MDERLSVVVEIIVHRTTKTRDMIVSFEALRTPYAKHSIATYLLHRSFQVLDRLLDLLAHKSVANAANDRWSVQDEQGARGYSSPICPRSPADVEHVQTDFANERRARIVPDTRLLQERILNRSYACTDVIHGELQESSSSRVARFEVEDRQQRTSWVLQKYSQRADLAQAEITDQANRLFEFIVACSVAPNTLVTGEGATLGDGQIRDFYITFGW